MEPAAESSSVPIKKICPRCRAECKSLHREWRGIPFDQALCPICANAIAVELIRRHEKTKPKNGNSGA